LKQKHQGTGIDRKLHDPVSDKLSPVFPLDLSKVKNISDLVRGMANTAFTGRQLGESVDVLEAMARDKQCFVVMTLAGAMTVAKQGLVICDLIDRGLINAVVSTGALMAHGLVEATGCKHYRYDPKMDDVQLYEAGYNRVYDTLEPEQNLDHVELVMEEVLGAWDPEETMCSWRLNQEIGRHLKKHMKGRGILKSAFEKGVPVFVPAFTDSELGLDVALNNRMRAREGKPQINFNPFLDLNHFAETLLQQARLGIFTIGGGVPRNWAQQFGPYCELRVRRAGENVPLKRYHYGVRVCPEPVHWGGLSGSPYSEAVSWGKFVPAHEGGRFGEVFEDATVGLPIMVAALFERLGKGYKKNLSNTEERSKQRKLGKSKPNHEGAEKKLATNKHK